ncbi:elongator complex protein 2 [Nematocida sp. AWRm77]|nr:elongator complex protein 2 [Nematocida sp. AWRm77]
MSILQRTDTASASTPSATSTAEVAEHAEYALGGCSGALPNTAQMHKDKMFYVCNRSILSEGTEYFPEIRGYITAVDISDEFIAVGSDGGSVCLIDRRTGATQTVQESSAVLSVRQAPGTVVWCTRDTLCISGENMASKQAYATNNIIVDLWVYQKESVLYIVSGTYNGKIEVRESEVQKADGQERKHTIQQTKETLSYKSEVQNISGVYRDGEISIAASFSSGKVGIFAYGTAERVLKKTDTLLAHRHSCTSAHWNPHRPQELITTSEDGTAVLWRYSTFWKAAEMYGAIGGPSVVSALMDSKNNVFLQTRTGGIYQATQSVQGGAECNLQHTVSGHTDAIVSVDTLGDLVLTGSCDRTVRIFQAGSCAPMLYEIARPVISGYTMAGAVFIDEDTVVSAADENILRVYKATNLYRQNRKKKEDAALSFTATQQELSLTTLPSNPEEKERCTVASVSLSEMGLLTNQFCEVGKVYGFPFEIKELKALPGKMVVLGCKSSQKEFSSLFVLNTEYQIVQRVEAHTLNITKIAVSPSQEHICTVGRDRKVALFGVVEGRERFAEAEVLPAFKSTDWGVKLLDVQRDHQREIFAVTFSSDGTAVYTSSRDKRLSTYSITEQGLSLVSQVETDGHVTALYHSRTLFQGTEEGEVIAGQRKTKLHSAPIQHITMVQTHPPKLLTATEDGVIKTTALSKVYHTSAH